jgi:RNA polymerase sigma factor (sigma-70 family)
VSATEFTQTPPPRIDTSAAPPRSNFAPTRWTLVSRARGASPEARAALSELCAFYYEPVFHFLRREGRTEDAARELTQEFFTRILSGSGFDGADHERGRFRSYLLGALKHFVADARDESLRLKRGAGILPESLDATSGEDDSATLQVPASDNTSPEANFDRQWALAIMKRTLSALDRDMSAKGKQRQFEILKPWLAGDAASISQAEAARALAMTEGAVKVLIHRLRKKFGELLRAELAQTLRDPAQADEELAHLIAALC